MPRITFSSARFLPYLPESAQVSPGAYGFELASWLSLTLAKAGFATSYPVNEEGGWYLEYLEDEAEFLISCGSTAEEGDGYQDKPILWHIYLMQNISLQQCLKGEDGNTDLDERLTGAIMTALRREGIEPTLVEAE